MDNFIRGLKNGRGKRILEEIINKADNNEKVTFHNGPKENRALSDNANATQLQGSNCILDLDLNEEGPTIISSCSAENNGVLITTNCFDRFIPHHITASDIVNADFVFENEAEVEVLESAVPDLDYHQLLPMEADLEETDAVNLINNPHIDDSTINGEENSDNCHLTEESNILMPLHLNEIATVVAHEHENNIIGTEVDDEQDVPDVNKKSRKRVRNESVWARNIKKKKVNTGEAYTTKSGNLIEKKCIKTGCDEKCKFKCKELINNDERNKILCEFLELADVNRKRDYVSKLMTEIVPKYSYKVDGSRRSTNYSYNLIVNSSRIRVCKKMFCDTLCISATYLTTVKNKTTPLGIVSSEKRGKHHNHRKIDADIVDGIVNHINSFPRIESHYCRADSKREYIDGDLDISQMYRLYKESCIEKEQQYAKKHKYDQIFNTKFNIGFFVPKKDQCAFCATYENSSTQEKENMENEMMSHKKEKELSRIEKKTDKDSSRSPDSTTLVACFDLQAVVQLPKGQISTFYYKRKLNTFNFTIYDTTSKQGHCYTWHEGCAKRGALEIASFVFDFLKEKSSLGKSVIFYSDNCSGQNKNHVLISMYLYAVQSLNIPAITHKYLIVGHTQNEGDTMHSAIERQIKRATMKTPLYVPSQITAVIQVSNKERNPFIVKEMDFTDVYDWNQVEKSLGKNFQFSSEGEKIVWANIKVFEIRKEHPQTVFYKTSYEQNEFKSFKLNDRVIKRKDGSIKVEARKEKDSMSSEGRPSRKTKSTRKTVNMESTDISLKPAYFAQPGVSMLKKADLISLCKDRLIPKPYHFFFENLETKNTDDD